MLASIIASATLASPAQDVRTLLNLFVSMSRSETIASFATKLPRGTVYMPQGGEPVGVRAGVVYTTSPFVAETPTGTIGRSAEFRFGGQRFHLVKANSRLYRSWYSAFAADREWWKLHATPEQMNRPVPAAEPIRAVGWLVNDGSNGQDPRFLYNRYLRPRLGNPTRLEGNWNDDEGAGVFVTWKRSDRIIVYTTSQGAVVEVLLKPR